MKLKYKHGELILDDFTIQDNEDCYGWTQICDEHFNQLTYDAGVDQGAGHGICGVEGCNKESDHYLDFNEDDVEEVSDEAQCK